MPSIFEIQRVKVPGKSTQSENPTIRKFRLVETYKYLLYGLEMSKPEKKVGPRIKLLGVVRSGGLYQLVEAEVQDAIVKTITFGEPNVRLIVEEQFKLAADQDIFNVD